MTLNRSRTLFLSVCNRLSRPRPRSNRCRGATRDGLVSGSPVPAAGTTSRLAERLPGAQLATPAAGARGQAVDLGMIPGHREEDGRVEQHVEVVSVVGALVEVADVSDEPATQALLRTDFRLVALPGRGRCGGAGERFCANAA